MAGLGHERQFPAPELSARYRFGQGTFSRMRGIERDAPKAAASRTAADPLGASLKPYSPMDS